ncbi:hypothetical protein L1887_48250 [Cichorium endivia]|nr:hypothetical protein L1887_48250 [Cichorium endivia]
MPQVGNICAFASGTAATPLGARPEFASQALLIGNPLRLTMKVGKRYVGWKHHETPSTPPVKTRARRGKHSECNVDGQHDFCIGSAKATSKAIEPGSSTVLLCTAARSNFTPECPDARSSLRAASGASLQRRFSCERIISAPLCATRLGERPSERLSGGRRAAVGLSLSLSPRDISGAGGAKRLCAGGRGSLGSRDWKRATSDSSTDALSSPKRSFLRSPSILLAAAPP